MSLSTLNPTIGSLIPPCRRLGHGRDLTAFTSLLGHGLRETDGGLPGGRGRGSCGNKAMDTHGLKSTSQETLQEPLPSVLPAQTEEPPAFPVSPK